MSVTVYGIRLKGDKEVRYIGFTRSELADRLKKHVYAQIHAPSYRPLLPWLRANRGNVEIFPIAKCETEAEARATESVLIALCLRLDHRLLNAAQVPWHLRQEITGLLETVAGKGPGGATEQADHRSIVQSCTGQGFALHDGTGL